MKSMTPDITQELRMKNRHVLIDAINLIDFITRCILGSLYIPRQKR